MKTKTRASKTKTKIKIISMRVSSRTAKRYLSPKTLTIRDKSRDGSYRRAIVWKEAK
jgi:hypothetical protein